jgi:hypothetical protein
MQSRADVDAGVEAHSQPSIDANPPPLLPKAALEVSGAFSQALERAFPAARAFAKASDRAAAEQASIVLYALADALDTIPGASQRAPDQLTEVRFEAKRLHRSDRLSFSLAHWIKEGLTAATRALEALSPKDDASDFWIAQARASTEAIDAKSGLTFQQAVAQDAIRATLDAFAVHRQQGRAP